MSRVLLAFEPPDGGVPEAVVHLAAGLPRLGWEVEVAAPATSLIDADLVRLGVITHRLAFTRGYRAPASDARATAQLERLLRTGRYDLLHVHSSKAGAIGRVAAALAGVPAVYTPHCFGFIGPVGAARVLASGGIEALLAPVTAVTICVCDYERHMAERAHVGPRRRLRTVLNASAPCLDRGPADQALVDLRHDGVLAVALAAMRPQKDLEMLVDATPSVLDRVPEARVAIVGRGPTESSLRSRARALGLHLDPRFAILPFRRPVAPYLNAMDVFVLPSAWEAFPIGVLEAMACGVPQVCTDVGGINEAVDESTGRLVPTGDAPALSRALIEVMSDPGLRSTMAAASRARHAERFTLERAARETATLYGEALARRS